MNKIVLSPKPSIGFELLDKCGLLELIFPELCALKGVETKEGIGHKDNFAHTLMVLDRLSRTTNDLWLRWAALLHDIAKPAVKRFDNRLGWTFHNHNFIGEKMSVVIFAFGNHGGNRAAFAVIVDGNGHVRWIDHQNVRVGGSLQSA